MTTIINGSSPSVTFSDGTTQTTAGLPLTGGTVTGNVTVTGNIIQGANAAPTFSAYNSGTQSLTASTPAKLVFNAENFDTNNNFDSTTNYRFTPTVAGYYFLSALVFQGGTNVQLILQVYKNGSFYQEIARQYSVTPNGSSNGGCLVYANGSTDYFEIYGTANVNATLGAGAAYFWFSGFLARSA
jgi:hypothetical protein